MYKTVVDYNDRNDTPLSNENILKAVHKVIEEESDVKNITADIFNHTYNKQRENANAILTSEKLDKSDDLADTLKDLTINDAEYYVSKSATANDAKGDPASDLKTITHTNDGKVKFADNSNGILKQKLLSKRTLHVVVLTMNPRIGNRIVTIGGAYQAYSKIRKLYGMTKIIT